MTLLVASAVDAAIVIAVALAVSAALRRRPAAVRHAVLGAAMLAAALMPALEAILPAWPLAILSGGSAEVATSGLRLSSSTPPDASAALIADAAAPWSIDWPLVLLTAWLLGLAAIIGGLLTGFVRLVRVMRGCIEIGAGPWRDAADRLAERSGLRQRIAILQSAHPSLLVTCGLFRPKIILPAGAERWADERRHVVLAHEIAHIRRGDWAVQLAAETLRAIYWFNPLVWIACRRLRHESEYACDDAVLDSGIGAADYASHLLDVARQAVGQRTPLVAAPAIAHPSTLERRISAMLTNQRHRAPLSGRAWAAAALSALAIAVPIAAAGVAPPVEATLPMATPGPDVSLTPAARPAPSASPEAPAARPSAPAARAQPQPAAFSGTLYDQSGGALPGVEIAFTDTAVGLTRSAVTDGAGRFRFTDVVPGEYEFAATLAGFATVTNIIPVAPGADMHRSITLPLGSLQELITAVCQAPTAARVLQNVRPARALGGEPLVPRLWIRPAPAARVVAEQAPVVAGAKPVRVGGQIAVPRQIKKVNPICPRNVLPTGNVMVILEGRIGIDGYLVELRHAPNPDNPPPLEEFVDSALDAVRQWEYTPTRLNNQPVEANVTITVSYSRG